MGLEYDDSVDDWDEDDVTGFPKFQGRVWRGRELMRKIARENGERDDDDFDCCDDAEDYNDDEFDGID